MSRPQRPCHQPHGTSARYIAGCSCLACCDANAAYLREWKRDGDRIIDAEPTRRHIAVLIYNGWRTRGIAEQAGVSYNTVRYCRTQRRTRIHRDSAAAILSLPIQTPMGTASTALVPARSTLRLIARLHAQGFTMTAIAAECGWTRRSLPKAGQHSVQARTALNVKSAAETLRKRVAR